MTAINLLPKEHKRDILLFYRMRFLVVVLLFSLALWSIAAVFLIPTFLMAHVKESLAAERIALVGKSSGENKAENTADTINTLNRELMILGGKSEGDFALTPALAYALERRTDGVYISVISLDRNPDNTAKMTLRGIARERDMLISFVSLLKQESRFASVELPVTNLAKSEEISFSVIINMKK